MLCEEADSVRVMLEDVCVQAPGTKKSQETVREKANFLPDRFPWLFPGCAASGLGGFTARALEL